VIGVATRPRLEVVGVGPGGPTGEYAYSDGVGRGGLRVSSQEGKKRGLRRGPRHTREELVMRGSLREAGTGDACTAAQKDGVCVVSGH
jgi:hypothetical protein